MFKNCGFYIPFALFNYEKTSILHVKGDRKYKKFPDYKVVPWKREVVLKN